MRHVQYLLVTPSTGGYVALAGRRLQGERKEGSDIAMRSACHNKPRG
jgi:hypothetical protein